MQFVEATGHPKLSIRWTTALALTHHSLAEGFTKLKNEALAWHRAYGVIECRRDKSLFSDIYTPNQFWNDLATRPGMFMGRGDGWTFYCFLNGMKNGGDWLNLPAFPRLDEIFNGITDHSLKHYGSTFGSFRVNNVKSLMEWENPPS